MPDSWGLSKWLIQNWKVPCTEAPCSPISLRPDCQVFFQNMDTLRLSRILEESRATCEQAADAFRVYADFGYEAAYRFIQRRIRQ